jgi:hypothetical protein
MVLLSSCVIKHYYCIKYHIMVVNNPDKKFYNIGPSGLYYKHITIIIDAPCVISK